MWEAIEIGLSGLAVGARNLALPDAVMMGVGFLLLYLGIKKGFEPLLLVPIGFGAFLVNLPLSGLMEEGGIFRTLFNTGIANELYPLLIFVGIGAMTDFGPLLENPKILLLGAAGISSFPMSARVFQVQGQRYDLRSGKLDPLKARN